MNKANISSAPCTTKIKPICPVGYIPNPFPAAVGPACIQCPYGSVCSPTGRRLPVAADGFWQSPETTDVFLTCTPAHACTNGTCAPGYTGTSSFSPSNYITTDKY
ncbi:hypothetical protein BKA69DRAFT_1235 [Paraphysoderma sedebokerense]|nr:hypothetical protein BKA69DRAFT_1235 [Paraphysoderma sedebokerense]